MVLDTRQHRELESTFDNTLNTNCGRRSEMLIYIIALRWLTLTVKTGGKAMASESGRSW